LDAALDAKFDCGGWCPAGRLAEDGPLPPRYPLEETPTDNYAERTEWNVRDSDGTLILVTGPLTGGTALTRHLARRYGKPLRVVDLRRETDVAPTVRWLRQHNIQVLNVAGPRASQQPDIYSLAYRFVSELLRKAATAKPATGDTAAGRLSGGPAPDGEKSS